MQNVSSLNIFQLTRFDSLYFEANPTKQYDRTITQMFYRFIDVSDQQLLQEFIFQCRQAVRQRHNHQRVQLDWDGPAEVQARLRQNDIEEAGLPDVHHGG